MNFRPAHMRLLIAGVVCLVAGSLLLVNSLPRWEINHRAQQGVILGFFLLATGVLCLATGGYGLFIDRSRHES